MTSEHNSTDIEIAALKVEVATMWAAVAMAKDMFEGRLRLAVEWEREACAKILEDYRLEVVEPTGRRVSMDVSVIVAVIRARGVK